jgi:2-succinyl-6-hydroxy-2,4-cyclohexadiene-1-carboxylate synthase
VTVMQWSVERGMVVRRFGSGPELVWIHGLGEQSSSFDPIARKLVRCSHVLVDLPGYGRSAWPASTPDGDSLEHLADLLASWLGKPAILVGHSMGGVLATLVAEQQPMRAVINIEGNLSRGDCTLSAEVAAYAPDGFAIHGFDKVRDAVYARGIEDVPRRGYYAALRAASPEVLHRNAVDLVAVSSAETLAGRFAALKIPTLFIAGAPSGVCERSRALLDRERVRTVVVEPAGHWPFIDRPDTVAAAIMELVETLDSAA